MVGTTHIQAVFTRPIGEALKEARTAQGIGVRELARTLGWQSHERISRYENGQRVPKPDTIAEIGLALGLTTTTIGELIASIEHARGPRWVNTDHQDRVAQQEALIAFEAQATRIVEVSPLLVPGLFQTPDYTRAIMESGDMPEWDAQARVETRAARSAILVRRGNPPHLAAYIGEEALTKVIGGPEVMHAQLDDLHSWADDRTNVAIHIIPRGSGYYRGLTNAYRLLEFDTQKPLVSTETPNTTLFFSQDVDIAAYRKGVDTVHAVALGPRESRALIADIAAHYETESESVA
jgi:transcriptional regulator with XRE-family HTH domain